jgi:hypothetical protein
MAFAISAFGGNRQPFAHQPLIGTQWSLRFFG